jgi:integron integrase
MPDTNLLLETRNALRRKHYSPRTEQAYLSWIQQFVEFHRRHPSRLDEHHVRQFLTHLAVERSVSASTQNQALTALLFLYREVLAIHLPWIELVDRAKAPKRVPTVFTRDEVRSILVQLDGAKWLVASLLYGTGMRLSECLQLRVKDLDFDAMQIAVRDGKGAKDRITLLPESLADALSKQLERNRATFNRDLAVPFAGASIPYALERQYPNAGQEWIWQYVFPAGKLKTDERDGKQRRHNLCATVVQRAVKQAIRAAGITKGGSCHTFRHSFATHMLEDGCSIRRLQELLGHSDVTTTMIYTHVVHSGTNSVRSPLDPD